MNARNLLVMFGLGLFVTPTIPFAGRQRPTPPSNAAQSSRRPVLSKNGFSRILIWAITAAMGAVGSAPTATRAQGEMSTPAAARAPRAHRPIPHAVPGKYNVAFVYVDPHDDGGWTQAHDLGRQYVEQQLPTVHTAYVESVPDVGPEAERVIRALARKRFNVIIATSFGYMEAMAKVAKDFPRVKFLHISGYQSNGQNFGNLFGAMEDMKYPAILI